MSYKGHCHFKDSVQFSHSVMSDSLWPHESQHARLPHPSPSPIACSNSCLLSQWCHPTISSSVTLFFFYPQSFPASGYFPVSWFFTSGGQSIGASASASVLPMNIQCWFPLELTGFISLWSKGFSKVFSYCALWMVQPSEFVPLYTPGGLQSMGSKRVRHDWVTKQTQAYTPI